MCHDGPKLILKLITIFQIQENMTVLVKENDSVDWGGSDVDHNGGFSSGTLCRSSTAGGDSQVTNQLCGSGDLIPPNIEFQPQPDVINGGYVSYGHVMDYNPPSGIANRNTIYDCSTNPNVMPSPGSVLNVSDPRYSATYGNPYLKQVNKERHGIRRYLNIAKNLSLYLGNTPANSSLVHRFCNS